MSERCCQHCFNKPTYNDGDYCSDKHETMHETKLYRERKLEKLDKLIDILNAVESTLSAMNLRLSSIEDKLI